MTMNILTKTFENRTLEYWLEKSYPIKNMPLIHCITNDISSELVANSLLFVGAKPIMAAEPAEIKSIIQDSASLLLNLGQITQAKRASILYAAETANKFDKPFVLDIVGINASNLRFDLIQEILKLKPTVVKGNLSEIRTLCGLNTHSKGVDTDNRDFAEQRIEEVIQKLYSLAKKTNITFLATGKTDLIVSTKYVVQLFNGVDELDNFVGTGDIIGAQIAAQLANTLPPIEACISSISYFNICGEKALERFKGLNTFRSNTLDYISTLYQENNWFKSIKGAHYKYEQI